MLRSHSHRGWPAVTFLLGDSLIASPRPLHLAAKSRALWNAMPLDVVIGATAIIALVEFRTREERAGTTFGLWLVVLPSALGISGTLAAAAWKLVIVGCWRSDWWHGPCTTTHSGRYGQPDNGRRKSEGGGFPAPPSSLASVT